MMHLLAEAGASDTVSLAALGTFLVSVGGIVLTFLKRNELKNRGAKEERERTVKIDGQPVAIKMEDQFVTRREFDSFKAEMRVDVMEMKGLFNQTMQEIKSVNATLTKDIRDMGTGAYQGRQKLWEKVNHQGERISRVEVVTQTPTTQTPSKS